MTALLILFLIFAFTIVIATNMDSTTLLTVALTAVSTTVATVGLIRLMFQDIIKDAKDNAAFKQHMKDEVTHLNSSFMIFSKETKSKLNEQNEELHKQNVNIAKLETKVDNVEKKLDN